MIHLKLKRVFERVPALAGTAILLLASLVPMLAAQRASALALLDRSLMVTSTVESDEVTAPDGSTYVFGSGVGQVPAGDPRNGTKVGHLYTFSPESGTDLEGFTIEYCTSAFAYVSAPNTACTGPTGFSASAWDSASITVTNVTTSGSQAFTVDATSANYLVLTSATALVVNPNDELTINFDGASLNENDYFVNPTVQGTYFATISTYAQDSEATAGTPVVDLGTVTNNVTEAISIYTRVQETLNFSVEGDEANDGATPADPGSTGACDPLTTDGSLTMGDSNNALSTNTAYDAKSYFRLATNSANGVTVAYSGDTLKSGANDINQVGATKAHSTLGTEQFGLAFDSSDGDDDLSNLAADTQYNSGNGTISDTTPANNAQFAFSAASVTTPVVIASAPGIVDCETGAVRYVANIGVDTPAGIYTTKLNYIATPSY